MSRVQAFVDSGPIAGSNRCDPTATIVRMMKLISIATAPIALASLCSPAWAIHKCTGPNGGVTFQDAPCVGQGKSLDQPPSASPGLMTPDEAKESIDKLKREAEIAEAIRLHRPAPGMAMTQLRDAMGRPTGMHSTEVEGKQREQLIFEQAGGTWYVYPFEGVVKSVHYQAGGSAGTAPSHAPRQDCPSEQDIRNAETSASSITLSNAERVERQRRIRAMRNCGR